MEKYSNLKFEEYPSGGRQAVPRGQTDMNEAVAFHNFANAPKTVIMISRNIMHNIMCSVFPFTYYFYTRPDDDSII